MGMRLRQLVFACETVGCIDRLKTLLDLDTPFIDPDVKEFGLTNAVFALGDQFLEIIVPVNPSAPARRFLDRNGEAGYMAIFQTDDLATTRIRCDDAGIRRVWNADLEDISASHFHPADTGGAIMSVDEARPASSWRWGGAEWHKRSTQGRILGADLTSPTPKALADTWARVLGLPALLKNDIPYIQLEDGLLRFFEGGSEALSSFHLGLPTLDPVFSRARKMGLPVDQNEIMFSNTRLILETTT